MKKIIIGLFIGTLLLGGLIFLILQKTTHLTFTVAVNSDANIPILVENIPVIKKGYLLIPVKMTTLRPISVSVGDQMKTIKINQLSKINFIPLDIAYRDKTVRYFLQTLPQMFPAFSVKNDFNQKGFVLLSLHGLLLTDPSYSFIMDMDGNIVFYRGHPKVKQSLFHLKKVRLSNGKIRYITHVQDGWGLDSSYVIGYHLIMDENFNEIDRVTLLKTDKHGALLADEHDIVMLDDGHYIITGQDIEKKTLKNGNNALITHTVIQEIQDGQVLLDWDSKDYPELMKACYEKCPELYSYNADYIHVNSLFIDPKDNHLLVSSASGYYIMKIHRSTGAILWILGGKANQFKIPKEAEFIRQHDVHILPDGRLILFDNHISSLSRQDVRYHHKSFPYQTATILILGLDEKNKKITTTQSVPLYFYAPYMGSAQQLTHNRWFVGCGSSPDCTARMVDSAGNILWNMKARPPYKMYRAYYYNTLR